MPRAQDYRRFRVESAEPYGWVVYLQGEHRTHFFGAQSLAVMYAKLWANSRAPSLVDVVDLNGRTTVQWLFPTRFVGGSCFAEDGPPFKG